MVVLLMDIIVNGILRTHLGLDSVRAMSDDPTKLIQASIATKVKEWLDTAPTADSIAITIEKSGTIKFVYYFTLVIGIIELGLAIATGVFAMKEEGNTKKISLVSVTLLAALGIYGVVAGILKISSKSEMTFTYTLTKSDIASINASQPDMVAKITAEITRLASLTENQAAMGAEITRLAGLTENAAAMATKIGEIMAANPALTQAQAQAMAAQQLFGSLAAKNLYGLVAAMPYVNMLGNFIGNLSGTFFRNEISEWLSNTAFEEYLMMSLSGTGLVGLLSTAAIGYRLSID